MANLEEANFEWQAQWLKLSHHWEETTLVWDDSVRLRFEQEYWNQLKSQVSTTKRHLERLTESIARAKRYGR